MEKCKAFALQNTAWYLGYEYKFHRFEQFDFYQERKESEGDDGKQ